MDDTLSAKLLGANRTREASRFLEAHPPLVIVLRLLFYAVIVLLLPWLAKVVPDTLFLAIVPFRTIYPIYLYLTAPLTTLRALLTSFDVLYVLLLGIVGTVALIDILRWAPSRTFVLLLVVLPFEISLAVLFDALEPQAGRLAGPHSTTVASAVGVLLFTLIPLFIFFDVVPDVTVNNYPLGRVGGKDVSFSSFSLMASSFATLSAFFLRWGVSAFKFPQSFITLKASMRKQEHFNSEPGVATLELQA